MIIYDNEKIMMGFYGFRIYGFSINIVIIYRNHLNGCLETWVYMIMGNIPWIIDSKTNMIMGLYDNI